MGLENSVTDSMARAVATPGIESSKCIPIGMDTTGSSLIHLDEANSPIAFWERRRVNPAALCRLWKDHTSYADAAEIIELPKLRGRLYKKAFGAPPPAGVPSQEWAEKLGLPHGVPFSMAEFDVQYAASGCGIAEGTLARVTGTGACEGDASKHEELTGEVDTLRPGESGLLALDGNNGNRTVLADSLVSGLLVSQTPHTTRAEIYRAFIGRTAFGARAIFERLKEYRVPVERNPGAGGIAAKNSVFMQIYADVARCIMKMAASGQACALGAAISAAVLAGKAKGGHDSFLEARAAMASLCDAEYSQNPANIAIFDRLGAVYRQLHDAFGAVEKAVDLGTGIKDLLTIEKEQTT